MAFFQIQPGLLLAIWPRQSPRRMPGTRRPAQPHGFSLSHNVSSAQSMRSWSRSGGGAVIVKEAQDTFWGGYWLLSGPDGSVGWSGTPICRLRAERR